MDENISARVDQAQAFGRRWCVIVARGRGSVTLKHHAQESRSSVTLERALTLERHAQESRSSVTLERALTLERHA